MAPRRSSLTFFSYSPHVCRFGWQESRALPPGAHLLTLQAIGRGAVLLRLAHIYQAGEATPQNSSSDTGALVTAGRGRPLRCGAIPRAPSRMPGRPEPVLRWPYLEVYLLCACAFLWSMSGAERQNWQRARTHSISQCDSHHCGAR